MQDQEPLPPRRVGPVGQIILGFLAIAVVIGLNVATAFAAPDATPAVAMVGGLLVAASALLAKPVMKWDYYRHGIGIGVGLVMGMGVLAIGMCFASIRH